MTHLQEEHDSRPEWYKGLLAVNSFEGVTQEDRFRMMTPRPSFAHGFVRGADFQAPAPAVKSAVKKQKARFEV